MARSGQRRGSAVLPARETAWPHPEDEDPAPTPPRYHALSDLAKTQLRALQQNAPLVRDLVRTEEGLLGFDHIQDVLTLELQRREEPTHLAATTPGVYLRGAALEVIGHATTDPVDMIPVRFAALCLSCIADQDTSLRRRRMDLIVAAVALALAGDHESGGYLLEEHGFSLDQLPRGGRFAIAALVPEMRSQLMAGFEGGSAELQLLSMIEDGADHFRIRDLLEEIAVTRPSPHDALEIYLFRIAQWRIQRRAYRSSYDQYSQAELEADPKLKQRRRQRG